MLMIYNYR